MIQQQLDHPESRKPMDAMFMVGGFSQSPYLQRRIKEMFKDSIGIISVVPRGELAVVRGAVLLGIQPTIVSQRIVKHTYGLQVRVPYDPAIDPEKFKKIGTTFCDVRFELIVKKKQKLQSNHIVNREYTINPEKATRLGGFTHRC